MKTIDGEEKTRLIELLYVNIKCSKFLDGLEGKTQCYVQHSYHHFLVVKVTCKVLFI